MARFCKGGNLKNFGHIPENLGSVVEQVEDLLYNALQFRIARWHLTLTSEKLEEMN
jgi:hypothetical protein